MSTTATAARTHIPIDAAHLLPASERATDAVTLRHMVLAFEGRGDDVALRYPDGGPMASIGYAGLARRCREVARGLIALEIESVRELCPRLEHVVVIDGEAPGAMTRLAHVFAPAPLLEQTRTAARDTTSLARLLALAPGEPIYLAGACVRAVMAWAPTSGSVGISVSIFNYCGEVSIGLIVDAHLRWSLDGAV